MEIRPRKLDCVMLMTFLVTFIAKSQSLVFGVQTGRVDGKRCQKKERNIDMNLPPMKVASWWREDGYETLNEEEEKDWQVLNVCSLKK